ncbi:PhaM family polyhydroxyalkanoate granule multifunctional regulatory protein [Pseudoduganella danionis]|uniref:PhaM family polyhydroxyalkanoate granule multifunctional regulatory protein n=1 Tax=Pseudoduganella danionis TaxID=1890295 RepID=UPI0035B35046
MTHPQMPNIPGANVMHDTLDFVKNLWGSMSVPGLTAPTLSVEELDKKINDLKAVEAWLSVNMNMLRGSIQALEVQRGTIATLKSVGASLASAAQQPASSDKSIFDANPYVSAFFHHARNADKDKPAAQEATKTAEAAKPAPEASTAAGAAASKPAASADAGAAPMANPAAWWNMLQEQFKQAVASTVPPAAAKPAAKAAAPAKAKSKAATSSAAKKPATRRAPAKPKAASSKA